MGRHPTHGLSQTPEYRSWKQLIQRCENPNDPSYKNYGGRGIKVNRAWRRSFEKFYLDMGARPGPQYSIERKDNNGEYGKENCCWATKVEQVNNRRNNIFLTYQGKTQTVAQWARELSIPVKRIRARLNYGWDHYRTLSE